MEYFVPLKLALLYQLSEEKLSARFFNDEEALLAPSTRRYALFGNFKLSN
jgi:hypothetical protein